MIINVSVMTAICIHNDDNNLKYNIKVIHMFILQSSKWLTPDDQWRIAAFPFSVIARPLNSTGLTKVSCITRFYHNPSNSVTFGLIINHKKKNVQCYLLRIPSINPLVISLNDCNDKFFTVNRAP